MSNGKRGRFAVRVQRVQKGGGGALGAQILKKKGTAAAAGCVEWLCSLRSREKCLEMNRPDGRMVLTWESSSLFPQQFHCFVL